MKPWEKMRFDSEAARPASVTITSSFERKIGKTLPSDYNDFLAEVNGGRPVSLRGWRPGEYALVPIELQGRMPGFPDEEVIIDYLLNAEDWADIYEENKSESLTLDGCYHVFVEEEPRLPPGLIPIGYDPGGSLFLLDVGEKRPGSVWFWARDWFSYDELERNPFHNIAFVADSFSEFISKIEFKEL